jgi:tryptophan halogenase
MENAETAPGAVRKVVIAGGGTSGWVAAMALSKKFGDLLDITLVESEEIGTIGVGESTVPPIVRFHQLLGIDEREFMRECAATFKVAIWFENWGRIGDWYLHPFGRHGQPTWMAEFYNFWLHARAQGHKVPIGEYCYEWLAAVKGRFALRENPRVNYAYHFDAALYSRYLRKLSEKRGVKRVEGKIKTVRTHANGFVDALELEDGKVIAGDLFIDCTGFRGLLIEGALKTGFEDWSNYLPCDRAAAFQTIVDEPAPPYTACYAHTAGWRWNIPVQHRVGNGVVFCSRFMSDDEARHRLVTDSGGRPVKEPWLISIKAGRRKQAWNKNVVAFGLAAGFVEPLESTSIHLAITGVVSLIQLFPFAGIAPSLVERYNEITRAELEHVRDFIVLHYHANEREEPMWKQCREMALPESLAVRVDAWRERAHAWQQPNELFRVDSWLHVMLGQGLQPAQHHPLARALSDDDMRRLLASIRQPIEQAVGKMPSQQDFIERYCKAGPEVWGTRQPALQA